MEYTTDDWSTHHNVPVILSISNISERADPSRAQNWPRPIVKDDQQSGKEEFSFTGVPLLDNY